MRRRRTTRSLTLTLTVALGFGLVLVPEAMAVKISDITHLQGTRTNRLTGMGLVVGLSGTGDGGEYLPVMRPLMQFYKRMAMPVVSAEEFEDVENVAIVAVEVVLPENGVREGERLDVHVSSVGPAESLKGGRLLMTPLTGPNPDDGQIWATAAGPITLEDEDILTVGRISQGATLERNWVHTYMVPGRQLPIEIRNRTWIRPDERYVTFVIDESHAEWAISDTIAETINREESNPDLATGDVRNQIALAVDPRTVLVRVPAQELENPAPFLARLEGLQLFMPYTEARVTINRKTGSIIVTGDAEIYPVAITIGGLTITTTTPEPEPTPELPRVEQGDWTKVDPEQKGGTNLNDLVSALNQLRVPIEDRIAIIEELHKIGKLHATLIVER